jgi:hypothetical protein
MRAALVLHRRQWDAAGAAIAAAPGVPHDSREVAGATRGEASLCRVGQQQEAAIGQRDAAWVEVRPEDDDDPAENPNLDFVLHDTVSVIEDPRAAGGVVLVHCVAACSRTPAIGALYAMRRSCASPGAALSEADPADASRAALERFAPPGR